MSITTRQTNLIVNQDWTKVYQTFKQADFQSYDFETLRKTMIDYLRNYYPEDFNDFTESSEYIALIDLIAFLGQSLAFRTDMNARENFFDTAERRDSILKLARLISYNPKRNIEASGYLKFDNTDLTSVTRLYISCIDILSDNAHNYLQTIDDSTSAIKGTFRISNTANVLEYVYFSITGNHNHVGDPGGWFVVPISLFLDSQPSCHRIRFCNLLYECKN